MLPCLGNNRGPAVPTATAAPKATTVPAPPTLVLHITACEHSDSEGRNLKRGCKDLPCFVSLGAHTRRKLITATLTAVALSSPPLGAFPEKNLDDDLVSFAQDSCRFGKHRTRPAGRRGSTLRCCFCRSQPSVRSGAGSAPRSGCGSKHHLQPFGFPQRRHQRTQAAARIHVG